MKEGELTRSRSALVRNEQLAGFARHLDLGRAMRMGRGEIASGGRNRDNLLGSTFEAVIGALGEAVVDITSQFYLFLNRQISQLAWAGPVAQMAIGPANLWEVIRPLLDITFSR